MCTAVEGGQDVVRRADALVHRVVLVREQYDADLLRRDEGDISAEPIRRARLVNPGDGRGGHRRREFTNGGRLVSHSGRVAVKQRIDADRIRVLLPDQVLRDRLVEEIAGVGRVDRLAQPVVLHWLSEVGAHEPQQVARRRLHAIGFLIEHARRDANRFAILPISPRIVGLLVFRYAEVGVLHVERLEDVLGHECCEVAVHCACGDPAEGTDTHVRIGAHRAGGFRRLPRLEVLQDVVSAMNVVRHLKRHAAGRVRAEIDEFHVAEGGACKFGDKAAGLVGEREGTDALRIGGERRGECLADRTQFEKRVGRDGCVGLLVGHAVIEDVGMPVEDDADGHAGDLLSGHERGDRLVDDRFDFVLPGIGLDLCLRLCGVTARAERHPRDGGGRRECGENGEIGLCHRGSSPCGQALGTHEAQRHSRPVEPHGKAR